ncbi:hypothetical protein-transmembrane prediction [hydrothermal vent metagenome]|uniref:Transposase IS200-like domain-containing protein n=1 Tax=hydrothermal vent metagenome TaxID=652676 RepID=A0A1W1CEY4_9ZZZZ
MKESSLANGGAKAPLPKSDSLGSGTSVPSYTTNKPNSGAKAPLPKTSQTLGSRTSVPPKTKTKTKTHLLGSGTSVPPNTKTKPHSFGSKTSVPPKTTPSLPKEKHTNLPHIDIPNYYQFITFRTFDSLDTYLKKLYNTETPNRKKQQAIDNYLDSSNNGAYLNGEVLLYLYDFLKKQDRILYDLVAFCIMPNHIHILCKPLQKLSIVMQRIKGATAHHINILLHKSGKFWAEDYYDKAIRDEKHFFVVYKYIRNNVLKIGGKVTMPSGGAKAPLPKTSKTLGSGTSVPSYTTNKPNSGAKAPLPKTSQTLGSGTSVPPKNRQLPSRFYGIYKNF